MVIYAGEGAGLISSSCLSQRERCQQLTKGVISSQRVSSHTGAGVEQTPPPCALGAASKESGCLLSRTFPSHFKVFPFSVEPSLQTARSWQRSPQPG